MLHGGTKNRPPLIFNFKNLNSYLIKFRTESIAFVFSKLRIEIDLNRKWGLYWSAERAWLPLVHGDNMFFVGFAFLYFVQKTLKIKF